MMLGAFELDPFQDARFPHLALPIFLIFTLLVAVIMLNAVIAIMVKISSITACKQTCEGRFAV